jgi:hypothetical protein
MDITKLGTPEDHPLLAADSMAQIYNEKGGEIGNTRLRARVYKRIQAYSHFCTSCKSHAQGSRQIRCLSPVWRYAVSNPEPLNFQIIL